MLTAKDRHLIDQQRKNLLAAAVGGYDTLEMLMLIRVEGMTYAEVGEMFRLRRETVRTKIKRAIARLKKFNLSDIGSGAGICGPITDSTA